MIAEKQQGVGENDGRKTSNSIIIRKSEMNHFLGYDKNDATGHLSGNSRNGFSSKTLRGTHGEIELQTPLDRNGVFEPQLVKKGQSRIIGMDDQILCLYAKGMSTIDIISSFQEMYGADISADLVSQVTNYVIEKIIEWQNSSARSRLPQRLYGLYCTENTPG